MRKLQKLLSYFSSILNIKATQGEETGRHILGWGDTRGFSQGLLGPHPPVILSLSHSLPIPLLAIIFVLPRSTVQPLPLGT